MSITILPREKIEKRIKGLDEWLMQESPECKKAQRHLEQGTPERVYWHYGYLVALRDVMRLLENENARLN